MSKLTQLTADQYREELASAKMYFVYELDGVHSSDPTVTIPARIVFIQDGNYYAEYADQPGAVMYQYLEDLLNDHSIEYGDIGAQEWLKTL